jgi:hypothetical protein
MMSVLSRSTIGFSDTGCTQTAENSDAVAQSMPSRPNRNQHKMENGGRAHSVTRSVSLSMRGRKVVSVNSVLLTP